jgi:hypothetical protein
MACHFLQEKEMEHIVDTVIVCIENPSKQPPFGRFHNKAQWFRQTVSAPQGGISSKIPFTGEKETNRSKPKDPARKLGAELACECCEHVCRP